MLKPAWFTPEAVVEKPIEIFETFLESIDSETLFSATDPSVLNEIRHTVREALVQLLVWQRPLLEASRSLQWPYDALRERKAVFEKRYTMEKGGQGARQAALFLALLPFPDQWQWLFRVGRAFPDDPEVVDFRASEQSKIEEKIKKKAQKTYKLHHFCQILKKPRLPGEKGIIRIFSLAYIFTDPRIIRELGRHYLIYIEPTAGVFFRHTWWRFLTTLDDPCLIGAASEEDGAFLSSQSGILTTRLAHGDFIEDIPGLFSGDGEKRYDLVFNGTYDEMERKRHGFLLSLMKHPRLKDRTALFMGRGSHASVDRFNDQVRRNRLEDRVTVMANLRRKEVPAYLNQCRAAVHLALHENGPRCIYEFFRSDLPCAVSSCTGGVNLDHINEQTGILAMDGDLPQAIDRMLSSREQYAPRKWFVEQCGTTHATKMLNRRFQEVFRNRGYDWSDDIVPLGSSGANRYVDADHYTRFRPEFESLFKMLKKKNLLPIPVVLD